MTAANSTLPQRDQLTTKQERTFRQALAQAIEGEVRFDSVSRSMYATDASVYQLMPIGVVIPGIARMCVAPCSCAVSTACRLPREVAAPHKLVKQLVPVFNSISPST